MSQGTANHGRFLQVKIPNLKLTSIAILGNQHPGEVCCRATSGYVPGMPVSPHSQAAPPSRRASPSACQRSTLDRILPLAGPPAISIALAFDARMGFEELRDIPPIYGVPYTVYLLRL
jgi:hypothetical protein